MVLEKTLESPLVCKGIQPVNSEGDQPGVFFVQADLGDIVGLVPDHHNKVNIAVKQIT